MGLNGDSIRQTEDEIGVFHDDYFSEEEKDGKKEEYGNGEHEDGEQNEFVHWILVFWEFKAIEK